jgi:hypothetical protein
MTDNNQSHATSIEVGNTEPAEVMVGSEFLLKLKLTCGAGCRMEGVPVRVSAPDGTGIDEFATDPDGVFEVRLEAPPQAGEHVWNLACASHEVEGTRHEEMSFPVSINAKPYATSLAVWEVPSPVVGGEAFSIRVGAKSAADLALGGRVVEVCDAAGVSVAQGCLSQAPLPGMSALHFADLPMRAPGKPGLHTFSARFSASGLKLSHEAAAFKFSVMVVAPPEHALTVRLVESANSSPIAEAQLRLGPYRAATDQGGEARIMLPKGSYELAVWKVGYDAPAQTVVVDDDLTVEIKAEVVPEEDPDAAWMM